MARRSGEYGRRNRNLIDRAIAIQISLVFRFGCLKSQVYFTREPQDRLLAIATSGIHLLSPVIEWVSDPKRLKVDEHLDIVPCYHGIQQNAVRSITVSGTTFAVLGL